jgi:hypothetical protein
MEYIVQLISNNGWVVIEVSTGATVEFFGNNANAAQLCCDEMNHDGGQGMGQLGVLLTHMGV